MKKLTTHLLQDLVLILIVLMAMAVQGLAAEVKTVKIDFTKPKAQVIKFEPLVIEVKK